MCSKKKVSLVIYQSGQNDRKTSRRKPRGKKYLENPVGNILNNKILTTGEIISILKEQIPKRCPTVQELSGFLRTWNNSIMISTEKVCGQRITKWCLISYYRKNYDLINK